MSCFFCNSIYHVTHNCDIHASIESRKKIVKSKDYCLNCFGVKDFERLWCNDCSTSKLKCYICFSRSHHTIYCPNLLTVTQAFSPKIDTDLLSRYVKLLSRKEIFLTSLFYPLVLGLAKPKPLKILYGKYWSFPINLSYSNCDYVVSDEAYIKQRIHSNLYRPISTFKETDSIFHLRHLEIECPHIFSKEVLQLLSANTKKFKCGNVKFHPKLSFVEIVKKAPNLETIDLCDTTNVLVDGSWADILLKFKKNDNFKCVFLKISDLNFNVENLAAVMNQSSSIVVNFYLYITVSNLKRFRKKKAFEIADQKFAGFFVPENNKCKKCFRITYRDNSSSKNFLGFRDYFLKNQ